MAARRGNDSTVTYVPKERNKDVLRRRILIGLAAVVALLGLAGLGKRLFFPSVPFTDGPERLHGVRVGDDWRAVTDLSEVGRHPSASMLGNPWKIKEGLMRPALREADLGLSANEVNELTARYTDDRHFVALILDNTVVAVLSTIPLARTNHAVGVGSDTELIRQRYAREVVEEAVEPLPGGLQLHLYRLPHLGLTFEARGGRVTAIALYPPKR